MKKIIRAFYVLILVLGSAGIINAQVCGNERVHYGAIDVGGYQDVQPISLARQAFSNGWADLRGVNWAQGLQNEDYVFSYEDYYTNQRVSYTETVAVEYYTTSITTTFSNVTTATSPITLSATPGGGTFSGIGVTGNTFDPANAGEGTHTIYYKAPSLYGCDWNASTTVGVTKAVNITGFSDDSFCQNDGAIRLNASPSGGTFSGSGVSGTSFYPSVARDGDHRITYTVSGVSKTVTYTVIATEQVYLTLPVTNLSPADAAITLSGGIPTGGTYTGDGVNGNTFDPSGKSLGTYTITYTVSANGCSELASDDIEIKVNTINIPPQQFCDGESHSAPADGGTFYFNGNPISSTFTSVIFGGAGTYTVLWKKTGFADAAVTVDVLAKPNVSFSGASFCQGAGSVSLSSYASPAGGTFSGTNVSGTNFNANASPGSYSLSYTYDEGSCSNSAYATFTITAQPNVTLSLPTTSVYQDAGSFTLSGGSPSGGTYYVDGARKTTFSPSSYSVGSHTVTYSAGSGSCTDSDSQTITVSAVGSISYNDMHLCETDATVTLQGNGGTFYIGGSVLSNDRFNPASFGVGAYNLTWKRTNYSDATFTITVHGQPSVNFSSLPSRCVSGSSLNLSSYADPSGGTFSGTGVSGSIFNQSTAGVGTHTIRYSISDSYCSNSTTESITVYGATSVTLTAPNVTYTDDSPVSLLSYARPTGGTFTVNGTASPTLNPSSLGAGTHTITYAYTNSGGCTTTESTTVTLIQKSSYVFNDISACTNDSDIPLSNNGGTYTIGGTNIGTSFSPSSNGVGTYTVSWTKAGFTNASFTITVNATPVITTTPIAGQCIFDTPLNLLDYVNPKTGSFSGAGVSATSFNPSTAGAGTHAITYSVSNSGGCYDQQSFDITVTGVSSLEITGLNSFCSTGGTVDLSGHVNHGGGEFTCTGGAVGGTNLYPEQLSEGTHTLTYTINGGTSCEQSDKVDIVIMNPPNVTLADFASAYVDAPAYALSGGSPSGGQYYLEGNLTNTVNPSQLGVGVYQVSYVVMNAECVANSEKTITVLPLQTNNFQDRDMCTAEGAVTLVENGGTFSVDGTNLAGGVFDPAAWGAGAWEITWEKTSYADAKFMIKVIENSPITVIPVAQQCITDTPVNLLNYVQPKTGVFSGTGISGSSFNASIAKAGTHNILYTLTENGCFSEVSIPVTVLGVESLDFSGINGYCTTSTPVDLSPYVSHPGGTFSCGDGGIGATQLFPDQLNAGSHTIIYTFDLGSGCEQADSIDIFIMNPPAVSLTDFDSVYVDASSFPLYGGFPSGGQYSVNGALTNTFNPSQLGIGVHTVKYVYSNTFCENSVETTIEVLALRSNNFQNRNVCIHEGTITLIENGGKFFIDGTALVGGVFDPLAWNAGAWEVSWKKTSYADAKFIISIIENPTITLSPIAEQCIFGESVDLINFMEPKNGTFSGNGINGSIFEPSLAKAGTHNILYTVAKQGCYSEISIPVTVTGLEGLEFSGIKGYCTTHAPVDLSPYVSHPGGTFSCGDGGVAGSTLYPEQLSEGAHRIKYTVNVGSGCEQSDSVEVFIMRPPNVSILNYDPIYADAAAFNLYGGSPSGGQYYINGQLSNTFNPSVLGIGVHTVKYVYSNSLCQNTIETTLEVLALHTNSFNDQHICLSGQPLQLTENGGVFSVDGTDLAVGEFDPMFWGPGTWEVSWKKENYANAYFTITVHINPFIHFDDMDVCLYADPIVFSNLDFPEMDSKIKSASAERSETVYFATGTGIRDFAVFDPEYAGPGQHEITIAASNQYCFSEKQITITVYGVEDLAFTGLNSFCSTDLPVDLSAFIKHSGGTFSCVDGGVTGTTLYPEQLSEGNHTIEYMVRLENNCTQVVFQDIYIMNPPLVTLPALSAVYVDAAAFSLYGGSPSGGQYYVDGTLTAVFDPSTAGLGTHSVRYVYANSLCENSAETTITVLPLEANFSNRTICYRSNTIEFPDDGGNYFINGVDINRRFNPAIYGVGTFTLTWKKASYDDTTFDITVVPNPEVSFSQIGTVCSNSERVDLANYVYPAGGTFTGKGIEQNQYFNPLAGSGSYEVLYSLAENGCVSQKPQTIVVDTDVNLTFTSPSVFCADAEKIDLNDYVNVEGCSFASNGAGVINNFLYPELMDAGKYAITATYTSASCLYSETRSIFIVEPTEVYINGLSSIYNENDRPFFLTGGTPEGGNYSVDGVSRSVFDPSVLGVGLHTVIYTYSSVNGCENSVQKSITVTEAGVDYYTNRTMCLGEKMYLPEHGGMFYINSQQLNQGIFESTAYGAGTYTVTWEKEGFADAIFDITVYDVPDVITIKVPNQCRDNGLLDLRNFVEPKTGTFSGPGLENSSRFNPARGSGDYTLLYTLSNEHCYTESVLDITVNELQDISFSGLNLVCSNSSAMDMRQFVSPDGGTFSCQDGGVIDNMLFPSMLSEGPHTIVYTVETAACKKSEQQLMYIISPEAVEFNTAAFADLYANSSAIYLDFATPKGGIYSVDGMQTNVFDPPVLGQGHHKIVYSYQDNLSGCAEEKELMVTVLGEKVTNFRDRNFCQNDAPFEFILDGGIIYLDNVQLTAGVFDPSIYSAGTYNAVWKKEGFAATEFSIAVYGVPTVIYVQVPDQCSDNDLLDLTNFVEPKSGSFSGPGLESSTMFNPAIGKGEYSVLYNIANAHCYSDLEMKIHVNELDDIQFNGLNLVCRNTTPVELGQFVSPGGGKFSCADGGVIDNMLYPSLLSEGAHTIVYTVESSGCKKTEQQLMYIMKPDSIGFVATQFEDLYANSSAIYLDFATPKGGTYYVDEIQTNVFDPYVLGQGAHKIVYRYEDILSGCAEEKQLLVNIGGMRLVNFRARNFCQNDAPFQFVLDGGIIYVDNMQLAGGVFTPSIYSAGTYNAVWKKEGYADTEFTISVYEVPQVIYVQVPDQCSDNGLLDLTNFVEPKNGSFSGPGLESSTRFNPAIGEGEYSVLYNIANAHCYSDLEMKINVNELNDIAFTGLNLVCKNASPIDMRQFVSPAGGTFFCADGGVIDNMLYPSILAEGAHKIVYTVDASGCTKSEEQLMYIISADSIKVDESVFDNLYANSSAIYLDFATPKGGVYYVDGMQTNIFDPQQLGEGLHTIDYYLDDNNGCASEVSVTVTIKGQKLSNYSDRRICQNEAPLEFDLGGGQIFVDNAQLTGGIFNPTYFEPGFYNAVWKKDGYADTKFTLTVTEAPEISLFSVPVLCQNDAAINLYDYVYPKTGTFSGLSLGNASLFDPSKFKGGSYTVAYTVQQDICIDIQELEITVEASENIVFEGLPYTICSGSQQIDLMELVYPATGTFTNNDGAVIDNVLYPSMLTAGIHTLIYTIQNNKGCDQVASKRIYILEDEPVALSLDANICQEAVPFVLTGGYPMGGKYYVDGVQVIVFDPSSYSQGLHTVEYHHTNMYGCTATAAQHITIIESAKVRLQTPQTLCDNGEAIMLKGGYPYGGQYAVNGKYMDSFDPKVYGQGEYVLSYEYSNGKCKVVRTAPLTVVPSSPVTIFDMQDICHNAMPVQLYGGSPSGGYYSVDGQAVNVLDPSDFTAGSHTLAYNVEQNACISTTSTNFEIYKSEDFSINIPRVCENDDVLPLNVVSPSGGQYVGPGVSSNQLDPSLLGAGTFYYEYHLKSSNGCSSVIPFTLTVNAAPRIEMPEISSVCSNANAFTLTASPLGGQFSGNGVVNSVYYPSLATDGIQNITYKVTNKFACSAEKTKSILVKKPQVLQLEDIGEICQNGDPVEMNFVTPAGGVYSGTGVVENVLYPEKTTPGIKTITYRYTDRNACVSEIQSKVTIRENPDMQDFYLNTLCTNDDAVELNTEMLYTKSLYMGRGVSNNVFDPELAGPGEATVRYLVVDEFGCSNYNEKSIKVKEAPFVFLQSKGYCQGGSEVKLQGGYPTGGNYTGNFVVNNGFMPLTTGVYDLRYSYTADNGCSEVGSNYVTVNEVPQVEMEVIPNICVNSESLLLQGASPAGGQYFLDGKPKDPITAFNPGNYGVGAYKINYQYSNETGCVGKASQSFQVMDTEEVSIIGLNSQYCSSEESFDLNQKGYPLDGTFRINGTVAYQLEPAHLTVGANKIEYTYTSTSGCSVSISKSVRIAAVPPAPVLDLKSIYCPGDRITIEPKNYVEDYSIIVQTPNAEMQKVEMGRKSYQATELNSIDIYYESALGCKSPVRSYAIEVEKRNPSFVTEKQNIEKGDALQIRALDDYDYITDYVWTFSDGGISYEPQPYHYFNIPGKNSFYLDYITSAGCTFSKDWVDYIWVNNSDGLTTAIDDKASARIKLYPNPCRSILNIVPGQSGEYAIAIFSKTGKLVRLTEGNFGDKTIHVDALTPGAYTLRLIFSDKAASKIFIVQ